MASYVINSGTSGYTRTDFISALGGLQPLLVSETNIKTVNGNSVLGSGNITVNVTPPVPQVYPQEAALNEIEKRLRRKAVAYFDGGTYDPETWESADENTTDPITIEAINPIDPSTGKRKYMSFGVFSDLHTMPTRDDILSRSDNEMKADITDMIEHGIAFKDGNGDYTTNAEEIVSGIKNDWPSSDEYYYGATAENTIRLAGAVAHRIGIDAIVCDGDMSSGKIPPNCYRYETCQIKKMFDKYVFCKRLAVDGNHDRSYWGSGTTYPQYSTNADWQSFLRYFNSPSGPVYINDLSDYPQDEVVPCNTYYCDFPYYKIRLIMRSYYDAGFSTINGNQIWLGCMRFPDSPDQSTELGKWSICAFSHTSGVDLRELGGFVDGKWGAGNTTYYIYGNGNSYAKGLGSFGIIRGHVHQSSLGESTALANTHVKIVTENKSFTDNKESGENKYHLSIFVYDTDNWKMHHLKLGLYNDANRQGEGYFWSYDVPHNNFD